MEKVYAVYRTHNAGFIDNVELYARLETAKAVLREKIKNDVKCWKLSGNRKAIKLKELEEITDLTGEDEFSAELLEEDEFVTYRLIAKEIKE